MKKLTIRMVLSAIFLLTIISLEPLSAQTKKNYIINGSFKNKAAIPSKVYLRYDSFKDKPADSTSVENGKYTFKGSIDASIIVNLSLNAKLDPKNPKDNLTLMLDNGVLNVVTDDLISTSSVSGTGTKANDEFHELTSFTTKESAEIKRITESEAYKTDEALKESVKTRSMDLLSGGLIHVYNYVKKNPTSAISPYFAYTLIVSGYMSSAAMDTLNRAFPTTLRTSILGKGIDNVFAQRKEAQLQAAAKQKALDDFIPLGSNAIEFTQNDVNDRPVSLSSFRGKYVLVDFWASWCAPCRAENPAVVKAFNTYKDKGFTVLGVSLDSKKNRQAWIDAIAKDGLNWTQVSDLKFFDNEAAVLYGVKSIPQNFLIDPNGIIVAKNLRGTALEEKLAAIFKAGKR